MTTMTDIRHLLKRMPYMLRVGNLPGGDTEFTSIQSAIDYANSQVPTAANRWTVLVWPGTYTEQITMRQYVDVKAVSSPEDTFIQQVDGTIIILPAAGGGANLIGFTIQMVTPTIARNMIVDNGVGNLLVVIDNCVFNVVNQSNSAHRVILLTGNSNVLIRRCRLGTIGGTADFRIVQNDTNSSTITLEDNDWNSAAANGAMIGASVIGTWVATRNTFRGSCPVVRAWTLATYLGSHNSYLVISNGNQFLAITSGSFTEKSGPQEYEVWPGMVIQHAITAAAADTPTPAVGAPYDVLIHAGLYVESLTGSTYVNLIADQFQAVTIRQADATILTLGASNILFKGITFNLSAPLAARSMIVEGGVPTARTGITFEQCTFTVTTPGGFTHRVMLLQAASNVTWSRCDCAITDGANPAINIIRNDTAGATIILVGCVLELNSTAGIIVFSLVAGTWTLRSNHLLGTGIGYSVSLGTIRGYGNRIVTTAAHAITGGSVVEKSGKQTYEVWPGMIIQHAITAAAADTPAPAASSTYNVLVHQGTYTEAITGSANVWITAAVLGETIIAQNDATVLTLGASNVHFIGIVFRLTAPSAARNMVVEGGVPTARTGVMFRQCVFEITTPGGFAHRVILVQAGSVITIDQSRCAVTDGTNPVIQIIRNDTAAAEFTLRQNYFELNTTNGAILASTVASGWTSWDNIYRGTSGAFSFSLGTFNGFDDNITATGTISISGGQVTEKKGRQQYEVWPGMVIQHAITAAAADTPAPAAAAPYEILLHAGVYTEAITGAQFVNLKAIARGMVTIQQNDATVVTLGASNVVFDSIRFVLVAPSAARNMVIEGGAPTARTGIDFRNCEFDITTPGGFTHRHILIQAASTIGLTQTVFSTTDGANPAIQFVRNDTVAATFNIDRCVFALATTAGAPFFSSVAGTWNVWQCRISGSCLGLSFSLGTFNGRGNTWAQTGGFSVSGGAVREKTGPQTYEVWAGMIIGHAITAAAADTPSPAAATPYTIVIGPGIYVEQVSCQSYIYLKGAGRDMTIIQQTDGWVITPAANVTMENFSVICTTPSAARNIIESTGAITGVYLRHLRVSVTTPGAFNLQMIRIGGGSTFQLEDCEVVCAGSGIVMGIISLSPDTVTCIRCVASITSTNASASGFEEQGNGGVMRLIDCQDIGSSARGITTTGAGAIIRIRNSYYRRLARLNGAIIDESPQPAPTSHHILERQWEVGAIANQNIATRTAVGGAIAVGGAGQSRLRINDNAADAAGVEQNADAAGALASTWTPARCPRYVMQTSVSAFRATTDIFWGLRAALGAAVPGAAEHHAGFIWDGANFRASSSNGAGVGASTNLTTPSTGAQHQLEVIIVGTTQVEFYVDGLLVATHATAAGVPTSALSFQEYEISDGLGGATTSDITLRRGWIQEQVA